MTHNLLKYVQPEETGIRTLFQSLRDAVILTNTRTQQVLPWMAAATGTFGHSASEALGLRIEELVCGAW